MFVSILCLIAATIVGALLCRLLLRAISMPEDGRHGAAWLLATAVTVCVGELAMRQLQLPQTIRAGMSYAFLVGCLGMICWLFHNGRIMLRNGFGPRLRER